MGARFRWLLMGSLLLIAIAAAAGGAQGLWASPGTGQSYTMGTLDTASGGNVAPNGSGCNYRFTDDILISATDSLAIGVGCTVSVQNGRNFTVAGQLIVQGSAANPVGFFSDDSTPAEGAWDGITFLGPGTAPSTIDNLTISFSTFGLRCLSCQNLTVRNMFMNYSTGDGVLVRGGSNLTFEHITAVVNTYASQSVIGITNATGVWIVGANGTNVADILTLWNLTNAVASGPFVGSGVALAGAWIDNATNVTVSGLSGIGFPTGVRLTRSTDVRIVGANFQAPTVVGINATQVNRLAVSGAVISSGPVPALLVINATNATIDNSTLSGTGFVLALNQTRTAWVNDSLLVGGNPASASLNGTSDAAFRNVSASGGVVGFLLWSSPRAVLFAVNASGAATDGIRAVQSGNFQVVGSIASMNGAVGIALLASPDATLTSTFVGGNVLDGVALTNATARVVDSTASANGRDGWSLAGGTVLNASGLGASRNARNGLLSQGGSHTLARSNFTRNGAAGLAANAGTMWITDGQVDNNTQEGVRFAPAVVGGWDAASAASLFDDEAVNVSINATGGLFAAANAAISTPWLATQAGGSVALSNVNVSGAPGVGPLRVRASGGGTFGALSSTFDTPSEVSFTGVIVDLVSVTIGAPALPLAFDQADATLIDLIIANAVGDALSIVNGSTVAGVRLSVNIPAAGGAIVDSATASFDNSSFFGGAGEGVQVRNGASLTLDHTSVRSFALRQIRGTAAGAFDLRTTTVLAPFAGSAVQVDGAASFSADASDFTAASGSGLILRGVALVSLTNSRAQAFDEALVLENGTAASLGNLTLTSSSKTAFTAADVQGVAGTALILNGSAGGASFARIADLSLSLSTLGASAGPALALDTAAGARLLASLLSGTAASSVLNAPSARLDGLTIQGGSLFVGASNGIRLANTTFQGGVLSVNTTLDFVGYNLTIAAGGGATGIALSANSSADLGRISTTGGAFGLSGAGGAYLRLRNSAFTGATTASVFARSYASLNLTNVSSTNGATGFDLRYSNTTVLSNNTVAGSALYGIFLDKCSGASLSGGSVTAASGTAIRVANSTGVRIERTAVSGGSTGLMLHNATGVRVGNLTVSSSARSIVAGNAAFGTLFNVTLTGATSGGIVAYNGSTVDFWNGTIASALSAPGFWTANATTNSTLRLYDSTHDKGALLAASGGAVEVYWSLWVEVRVGGAPYPGAGIALTDALNASRGTATAAADGTASFAPLLELRETAAGRDNRSPYRADAALRGLTGSTTFDLVAPTRVLVDARDTEGPNLEVRPNQPVDLKQIALNDTVTFGPRIGDNDNVDIDRYTWTFSDGTGVPIVLTATKSQGYIASHRFPVPGHYPAVVQAFDAAGNPSATFLDVEVWVNDPPFFVREPTVTELFAIQGLQLLVDLRASDNDTRDVNGLGYNLTGLPGATVVGGIVYWTPSSPSSYTFTITVSDMYDQTSGTFSILVGSVNPGNNPPRFTSPPLTAASTTGDYSYAITVEDVDADDTIIIQFVDGPEGMSFRQNNPFRSATLSWQPGLYYGRGTVDVNLEINVSLRAFDGAEFAYQNFTIILRNPPDIAPQLGPIETITLVPGQKLSYDLSQLVSDPDDPSGPFTWRVIQPADTAGTSIALDTQGGSNLTITSPGQIQGLQSFFITVRVTDSSGLSSERIVRVDLKGPTVAETAFWPLLVLLIAGGIGAAFAIATRQRAAALAEEGAPAPRGGPSTSPAAGAASAAGFPFYIEAAALYDRSDALVASQQGDRTDLESVFVLLPSKARSASLGEGVLRVVRLENHDVALLRKGDATLAAIGLFAGDPTAWLEDPMKGAADHIQARAEELDARDLEALSSDAALAEILKGLIALSAGVSREAVAAYVRSSAVRAGSVVELVQGLVRLKVAVDNNSGQLAGEVRLSVEFDEKVMRLERMEPAFEQKRDKIQLGNLRPGERKTVALYFDPQICTKSFFNATVSWEDAQGAFHTTSMRTRAAEVACPAFSTARTANTAMLKRMLKEELTFRDSKYFRFPAQTSPEQVFDACKGAVLAQDVRLVKEFIAQRPYRAEAWFFGETSIKRSPMVIWTAVFGEERVAQFSAASNTQAAITGLLAELGRRLVDSRAGGGLGAPIESIAKTNGAAEVGDRATLLSKSQSAEADSE